MHSTVNSELRKQIGLWLIACMAMVAVMVIIGGLTRLTESGLSMVEWKPTTIFPPMNEMQWQEEFSKYQHSPQFQKINHRMNVAEFKGIFWLEYIHRLLGRGVGFVFFLPFLYFLYRKALPKPLAWKLSGIFLLGGLQGVIGWYMVKSGLVDQPWVSPARLAMHLGLAFIIFALLLWQYLQWVSPAPRIFHLTQLGWLCVSIVYLQILLGALVAGMDAGLVFNTFPDMNGQWIPDGLGAMSPWYFNLIENPTTAHAIHRYGALAATAAILYFFMNSRNKAPKLAYGMLAILAVQITLGALTVIHAVPIALASLHQGVALLLLAYTVALSHGTSPKAVGQ